MRSSLNVPPGDISTPVYLTGPAGPWIYAGDPNSVQVMVFDNSTRSVSGLSGWTLTPSFISGMHVLAVLESALPTGFISGTISVTSPANAFNAELLDVTVDGVTIQSAVTTLADAYSSAHQATDLLLGSVLDKLDQLLVVAEYNVERTITWNQDGSQVVSIDLAFVGNDAAIDFSNPDKKMRITYTRDQNGRVQKAITREVIL